MAKTELSRSKSICVLAVVVCCFAILWPKIFLPMFQSALSLSSAPNDNQRSDATTMLPPKVREAMKLSRPEEFKRLPGRMVFKNKSDKEEEVSGLDEEETNKPIIADFKMDPEHRKLILSDEYDGNGKRVKCYQNIKRKTKRNLDKYIEKSEKVLHDFGKDKVSKALHVLIRDMEEFKAKLLEVEQTKRQIREVGSTKPKHNITNVCLDETQKEENEESNEKQNNLDSNTKQIKIEKEKILTEDNGNEEIEEQMKSESNIDSEYETTDENEVNENSDYPTPGEEYELKEELLKNLESYYWKSLLKGMKDLKHPKEE